MLRNKKCLTTLDIVKVTFLLFLITGFVPISKTEAQPTESKGTPVIGARTDKLLRAMGAYLKTAEQFYSGNTVIYQIVNDPTMQ